MWCLRYFLLVALVLASVLPLACCSLENGVALIRAQTVLNLSEPSWINGTDPCLPPRWSFVYCTRNDVTTLNLSSQGLSGYIPQEIGELSQLTSLDLRNNHLTGSVPPAFDGLASLQNLYLTGNNLTGPFPAVVLQLTNLVDLRLDQNSFSGRIPEQIGTLVELTTLLLGGNNFTGPIPGQSLLSLVHLSRLELWGNPFNTALPVELGLLPNLTILIMHSNGLTGQIPISWSNSISLEILEMYNNKLTGTVDQHSILNLKQLRLDHNELVGYFPRWTNSIKNFVNLGCNYFTGKSPAGYDYNTSWKGNCFDETPGDHTDANCDDGTYMGSCYSFLMANPLPPPPALQSRPPAYVPAPRHRRRPVVAVVVAFLGVLAAILVAGFAYYKCRRNKQLEAGNRIDVHNGNDPYSLRSTDVPHADEFRVPGNLRRFPFKYLKALTGGFSKEHEIGAGGFGKVYYGQLETGEEVAIKVAHRERVHGAAEFRNEIMLLSKLSHPNLLRIKGFCDDNGEQILVYEFMRNGNLHDSLKASHPGATLDWYKRLEIAESVARALHYLHCVAEPRVIHRDVKPSNILLDANMVAKLADFGITKVLPHFNTHVSTRPAGTAGYLDPDYFLRFQLTTASDVFSYGVVLLELITGQKAIDKSRSSGNSNLPMWVHDRLQNGGVDEIIDPLLKVHDYPKAAYQRIAWLALDCSAPDKNYRPSIQAVLHTLEDVMKTVTPPAIHSTTPPQPARAFFSQELQLPGDTSSSTGASSSIQMAPVLPR